MRKVTITTVVEVTDEVFNSLEFQEDLQNGISEETVKDFKDQYADCDIEINYIVT